MITSHVPIKLSHNQLIKVASIKPLNKENIIYVL
jgi:hypothetical protein